MIKNRIAQIRALAFFDATEYVQLMRKESPESLVVNPKLGVVIDVSTAEKLLSVTRDKLDWSPTEAGEYLCSLSEHIKTILSSN